ncbi:hypothetical protein GJ496_001248 [Pomphorhynchus laevis]|nr:hypothetical protein GJ496_001248 [Pomphorhynchus laevis]
MSLDQHGIIKHGTAGGLAGLTVDVLLFPLDAVKTRMQSRGGFRNSGGFSNIYRGILPVLIVSVPSSSVFFTIYSQIQQQNFISNKSRSAVSNVLGTIISACGAECVTCIIRVPFEITKQRMQVNRHSMQSVVAQIMRKNGPFGFYSGFIATLAREIPFAVIQYPLWEAFKKILLNKSELISGNFISAVSGLFAGSIAGFITTPLDLIKTRKMLDQTQQDAKSSMEIIRNIYHNEGGIVAVFKGAKARTCWIGLGGFVYLGSYGFYIHLFDEHNSPVQ